MINYESIKPLLFKLQPENAHHVAECVLRLPNICQIPFNPFLESHFVTDDILTQELFGRTFYNPDTRLWIYRNRNGHTKTAARQSKTKNVPSH